MTWRGDVGVSNIREDVDSAIGHVLDHAYAELVRCSRSRMSAMQSDCKRG